MEIENAETQTGILDRVKAKLDKEAEE